MFISGVLDGREAQVVGSNDKEGNVLKKRSAGLERKRLDVVPSGGTYSVRLHDAKDLTF
jgi:hypothetical protein